MNRLDDVSSNALGFLGQERQGLQRSAGHYFKRQGLSHPGAGRQRRRCYRGLQPRTDAAITVVARAAANGTRYLFKPLGPNPGQRYAAWSEISLRVYSQTGSQLTADGVQVPLPAPYSSDIVHIDQR